jgi:hypothetical protein
LQNRELLLAEMPHAADPAAEVIYRDYAGSASSMAFADTVTLGRTDDFSRGDGSLADNKTGLGYGDRTWRGKRYEEGNFEERRTMNAKLLWGLAICVIVPLCAGCANAPGVVRAQSPAVADGSCPGGCGPNACGDGCSGSCLPHHEFFYHYTGPEKGCCLDGCCLGGCCCLRNGCCCLKPYSDCLPDCLTNRGPLVYPTNPSPGALVQYPYYCCKGPDDFFYPAIGTIH